MATAEKMDSFVNEAESCREFSSKLYKVVSEGFGENVIISPLSVHVVLSYLSHGASGETALEMINGLSIKDTKLLHIGYKSLLSTLDSVTEADLRLANAAFVHENVQLLATFSTLGKEFYNFSVQNIDFQNNIDSAITINNWVADKTDNMITDIINSSDITDDTRAILINALYFKGLWKYPFDIQHTENKIFHLTKDTYKQVPTMKNKHRYTYGELAELESKFIEIPYKDENLSMLIILPDETYALSSLEKNFNWNAITQAATRTQEIVLQLPKFKIECTLNLKETLSKIGFQSMFEDVANFSDMTVTPVKISKIIQKVFIEIDEKGSEAAAATVVQMRLKRSLDLSEEFIVDRPFMFIIRHKPSDIPLFIGSVRDIGVFVEKDEL
ncbi:hypothetical protein PV326_003145 [Microctonus aethiopoides]|nr:hypothetical protein PV326_003145 [Microctonus aethiopoides]